MDRSCPYRGRSNLRWNKAPSAARNVTGSRRWRRARGSPEDPPQVSGSWQHPPPPQKIVLHSISKCFTILELLFNKKNALLYIVLLYRDFIN